MQGTIVNRILSSNALQQQQQQENKQKKQAQAEQNNAEQPSSSFKRDVNAALGDAIDDKMEDFLRGFDDDYLESQNASTSCNNVYLKNSLNVLQEGIGGQSIYD